MIAAYVSHMLCFANMHMDVVITCVPRQPLKPRHVSIGKECCLCIHMGP